MQITVEFHGVLRRLAGQDQASLKMDQALTVADAIAFLEQHMPNLGDKLPATACARGDQLLHAHSEIFDGDTLVLLPPVSGG